MTQKLKIIIAIVCFIVAGTFLYFTFFRGSDENFGEMDTVWFKCSNVNCNVVFSLSPEELAKQQGTMALMPGQAFKCTKCNQQRAFMAEKCKKCNAPSKPAASG